MLSNKNKYFDCQIVQMFPTWTSLGRTIVVGRFDSYWNPFHAQQSQNLEFPTVLGFLPNLLKFVQLSPQERPSIIGVWFAYNDNSHMNVWLQNTTPIPFRWKTLLNAVFFFFLLIKKVAGDGRNCITPDDGWLCDCHADNRGSQSTLQHSNRPTARQHIYSSQRRMAKTN